MSIYGGPGTPSSRPSCIVIPSGLMRKWDPREVVHPRSHRYVHLSIHGPTYGPAPEGLAFRCARHAHTGQTLKGQSARPLPGLGDTATPSSPAPSYCPSICLALLSPEGVGVGGQGQGTRQINMALVFPEARAALMTGLIERRSVKRILIDLTTLIRTGVWKGPPLGP